ncbi:hypothetical protein K502DRAFT_342932 [Neoconidiobolus thromboides FSU 785]|nr:hypothetical protein K502DRAFT_342932 [Neoconidiobolus thromboides FSU 785]
MIFNTLVSLSLLATAFAAPPQRPSQAQSGIHRRASPASPAYPQMAQSGIHRRAVPSYPQSAQSGIHRRCDGFGGWGGCGGWGGWGGCGGCGFFPFIVQDFNAVNDNNFCVSDFNRNTEAAVFCDNINDFNAASNCFNAVNENLIIA